MIHIFIKALAKQFDSSVELPPINEEKFFPFTVKIMFHYPYNRKTPPQTNLTVAIDHSLNHFNKNNKSSESQVCALRVESYQVRMYDN